MGGDENTSVAFVLAGGEKKFAADCCGGGCIGDDCIGGDICIAGGDD